MGILRNIRDAMVQARTSIAQFSYQALVKAWMGYYSIRDLVYTSTSAAAEPESNPLRNPVSRLVEFYVSHIWPTLPEIVTENEKLIDLIHQIWEWSNWEQKKNLAVRMACVTGDFYLKVAGDTDEQTVRLQVLKAEYVTELDVDDRGVVQYIRLDIPQSVRDGDEVKQYTYIEIWNHAKGVRVWDMHDSGAGASVASLGSPTFVRTLEEVGTPGFIPIVHVPFRDVGETHGIPAFWPAITKIDEADNLISRLHSAVFRYKKPMWAVENVDHDPAGRALPAPPLNIDGSTTATAVDMTGEKMLSVSGTLKCLVPQISLSDALDAVRAQQDEIEKDLPELLYYNLTTGNSGLATATVRLIMAPAVARLIEARANMEAALIRAHEIALTMAQNMGLPGFSVKEIGGYEGGRFAHHFEEREILPMSEQEDADLQYKQAQADQLRNALGVPKVVILKERGYTDEEIAEFAKLMEAEKTTQQTEANALINAALTNFNQGAV